MLFWWWCYLVRECGVTVTLLQWEALKEHAEWRNCETGRRGEDLNLDSPFTNFCSSHKPLKLWIITSSAIRNQSDHQKWQIWNCSAVQMTAGLLYVAARWRAFVHFGNYKIMWRHFPTTYQMQCILQCFWACAPKNSLLKPSAERCGTFR